MKLGELKNFSKKWDKNAYTEIADLELDGDVESLAIEIYYMDFPQRQNGITKWKFIGQTNRDICRDRAKRLLETLPKWLSLKGKPDGRD